MAYQPPIEVVVAKRACGRPPMSDAGTEERRIVINEDKSVRKRISSKTRSVKKRNLEKLNQQDLREREWKA